MRKPIGFIDKVRIIYYWMKQHNGCGLITVCEFCNSSRIKRVESDTVVFDDNTVGYSATYKCLDCGATGVNKEQWNKTD